MILDRRTKGVQGVLPFPFARRLSGGGGVGREHDRPVTPIHRAKRLNGREGRGLGGFAGELCKYDQPRPRLPKKKTHPWHECGEGEGDLRVPLSRCKSSAFLCLPDTKRASKTPSDVDEQLK